MPGLLRGVARTAVVAGTATAVSNRVSRRQAAKWGGTGAQFYGAEQQGYAEPQGYAPPPPPAAAAPAETDPIDRLRELAELRDSGVLTDEEFAAAKSKVLAG